MNVYVGGLYKEVEYIQSSGTQYINTGYTGSSNTKIDTKLSITTRVGNYDFFYGSSGNGTGGQPCTFIQSNYPENNKIRVVNYANSGSNKRYVDSINNLEYGKTYNIIHTNTSFIIDGVSQGTMSATTYTLTYPLWIFGVNNRGSFAQPCAMKLYSFKIYESGTLVRDFIPCYRVSDNVIGLFDKVENKFYTNAGTGSFTKGADVKTFQPELKNAYIGEYEFVTKYQEVEYIQSSGTQYIDTGYVPTKNIEVQMEAAFVSTSTTQQRLFGVHSSNTSSFTFDIYNNGGNNFAWSATDGDSGNGGYVSTGVGADTNIHTFIHSNTNTQILTNGVSVYSNTRAGYITTNNPALGPLPLFCGYNFVQNPNGYALFSSIKMYSCKIYDNGTLLRDFIPCYRKSDSVIGLYDLVNSVFYTNSGSGTFTKGPDVN